MDGSFFLLLIFGGIILLIAALPVAYNYSKKQQAEEEEAINEEAKRIISYENLYTSTKERFEGILKMPYNPKTAYSANGVGYATCDTATVLNKYIDTMEEYNNKLPGEYRVPKEEFEYMRTSVLEYVAFGQRMKNVIAEVNMLDSSYGNVNIEYFNYILSLKKESIDSAIKRIDYLVNEQMYQEIWKTDTKVLIDAIWFYAMNKPFSSEDFEKSKTLLNTIYLNHEIQWFIAEAYAINQMRASDVLRDKIKELLESRMLDVEDLTLLASSFMWMKAYNEEAMILNYMLSNKIQMSAKLQERLHSLSNGEGNTPVGHNVISKDDEIYVDVSSLSWTDKEFEGFFEKLIFQEKALHYSLAIRDDDKDLFINKAFSIPGTDNICKKISELFEEEFGSDVSVKKVICNALSGNGSEKIEGILARSNVCKQLGVFVNIVKIGKKVNIKFYTLYLPEKESVNIQKQKVISLYQKLSPVVIMWEKSIQETILLAIQHILNNVMMIDERKELIDNIEVEF